MDHHARLPIYSKPGLCGYGGFEGLRSAAALFTASQSSNSACEGATASQSSKLIALNPAAAGLAAASPIPHLSGLPGRWEGRDGVS